VETPGYWYTKRKALIEAGWPAEICTEGRIRAAVRDWEKLRAHHQQQVAQTYGIKTTTFAAQTGEIYMLPVFDGEPRLSGNWIVCGDVHLPTTDFDLAERMLEAAKCLNIRNLLIVGDLVNMEAFSQFEHIVPPPPFEVECKVAARFVSRLSEHFETMMLVLGNHEHRLLKRNNGNINATMLGHILSAASGKLQVSAYAYAIIDSYGTIWRATHQRNYSRITGRLGDQLAQKFQCNIITFHQHHVAQLMDTWGRYVVIDGGGLFDDSKMAYVKLIDSNMPAMARGFVILAYGTAYLMTPYPALTDWEVILAGLQKKSEKSDLSLVA